MQDAYKKDDVNQKDTLDIKESTHSQAIRIKRSRPSHYAFAAGFITLFFMMIASMSFFIFTERSGDVKKYILQEEIKKDLVVAITNGADLRSIKNIYDNRQLSMKKLTDYFSLSSNKYYDSNVSLSKVLEDIRSNQFLDVSEKIDLEKLDDIINKHNQTNPFDSLEPSQKDSFENVRLKLSERYQDIEIEVGKIVKELAEKNSLVNKYLAQSTVSYWISIAALILSLFIGVYQIVQSRLSSSKIVNELISKIDEKESDSKSD